MQVQWLRQTGSDEVIVIFGGWALGPTDFVHLCGENDVLFVDDFRELEALPDLGQYSQRCLIAYSFGIAAYGHWQAHYTQVFDRRIAVNGSLRPVDRKHGIPPVVFHKTHETLDIDSYQDFRSHCFNAAQTHQEIDVQARKLELAAVHARGDAPDVQFDRIWISAQDRIFPVANLRRAWADQADKIREIEAAHVPFARWSGWNEVCA